MNFPKPQLFPALSLPSQRCAEMGLPPSGDSVWTHSQPCLLLFFLPSVPGALLLLGLQLICPQPSTEHRKVSHGRHSLFAPLLEGPGRSGHFPASSSI
jgi:hypothetical protein